MANSKYIEIYLFRVLCLILGMGVSPQMAKAEWTYAAGVGLAYTDNSTNSAVDTVDETSVDTLLAVNGDQASERVESRLASNLFYRANTKEGTDELRGAVDGRLTYMPLPDYLHFNLTENFGQIRQNLSLPDSRTNQANFNVLSAGVDFIFPFGKRSSFLVSEGLSKSQYDQTELDSTRTTGSAALQYALTERSFLLTGVSDAKNDFDNLSSDNNYKIQEAIVGYRYRFNASFLELSAGKTRVRYNSKLPDGSLDSPVRTLLRASVRKPFGNRSVVGMTLGSIYSDASASFVVQQSVVGVNQSLLSSPLSSGAGMFGVDAAKTDYAYLTLGLVAVSASFDFSAGYQRVRHEKQFALDSNSRNVQLRVTKRVSPRMNVVLNESYYMQNLDSTISPFKPDELDSTIGFDWRLSSKFYFLFEVTHADGVIGIDGGHFKTNSAVARIFYGMPR